MPVPYHGEAEAEHRVLRGLQLAVELSLIVLVIESVGAYYSRSLSLTVDAVHNVPDLLAFSLSWTAIRTSSKGATAQFTFGAHRLETFAGLANAALVLGAGGAFGYAAVSNLLTGSSFAGPVDPVWLVAAALPTLVLRGANLTMLRRNPDRVRDLNLSSVLVHLASDLAITGALLATGVVLVLRPGLAWADPLAALLIAGILVWESLPLFRDGWDVLTERTPRNLSVEAITRSALSVPGVAEIHDVHVWAVCSSLVCLTAHVGVREMTLQDATSVVSQIRQRMGTEFGIVHSTFEVECLPAATG